MQNIMSNFELLSQSDLTKYAGNWIAVLDGRVVAHGRSFKEVYQKVKSEHPNERPLIGKLPEAVPSVYSVD